MARLKPSGVRLEPLARADTRAFGGGRYEAAARPSCWDREDGGVRNCCTEEEHAQGARKEMHSPPWPTRRLDEGTTQDWEWTDLCRLLLTRWCKVCERRCCSPMGRCLCCVTTDEPHKHEDTLVALLQRERAQGAPRGRGRVQRPAYAHNYRTVLARPRRRRIQQMLFSTCILKPAVR